MSEQQDLATRLSLALGWELREVAPPDEFCPNGGVWWWYRGEDCWGCALCYGSPYGHPLSDWESFGRLFDEVAERIGIIEAWRLMEPTLDQPDPRRAFCERVIAKGEQA